VLGGVTAQFPEARAFLLTAGLAWTQTATMTVSNTHPMMVVAIAHVRRISSAVPHFATKPPPFASAACDRFALKPLPQLICIPLPTFADAESADADPATALDRLVEALIDVTLANRESGGLYRWQARYLHGDDQSTLGDQLQLVNRRIQRPLMAIRPTLTSSHRWMLSSGLLSVIAGTVDHRVQLPADKIRALLAGAASAVLSADLLEPADALGRPASWRIFETDTGVYEALLQASMVLFNANGYPETSMAEIASAVGMPVSGIYRYFPGKCDILATGLRRAADRVSGRLSAILTGLAEPHQMSYYAVCSARRSTPGCAC
jgi:hypothetical protein